MKLRIARKMDSDRMRDGRIWWQVYTADQLHQAEKRLRRSWARLSPIDTNERRKVTPDYFASNRVQSRRIRQQALKRLHRERRFAPVH